MIIAKQWAMPNSNTFSIRPIYRFICDFVSGGMTIIDPFANDSSIGTITNDLNPDYNTDYHMDALEFLKMLPDNSADVVLYDPPYSLRQVVECYKSVGREVTMQTTQSSWRRKHLDEIARIVKPNGFCLSFGWNSNGVGRKRGFRQEKILLVAHGGSHNDTICVAERKMADYEYQSLFKEEQYAT